MPGSIDVNGTTYRLDLKPSGPDFRNWQFRLRMGLPVDLKRKYDLKPWWAYDQGAEGSCTANASVKLFRLLAKQQGIADLDLSRAMQYYDSRLIEGTQNSDSGASISDSLKALFQFGACPEADFPYRPGDFARAPSQANYKSGLDHKALKYESVDLTHDIIGAALDLGHPVTFGFAVYSSFGYTGGNGIVPFPSGSLLGYHNILITGWDLDLMPDYYIIDNSWGDSWGATIAGCPGRAWMPRAWVENPSISFDGGTIDLVSGTPTPPPPPTPTPKVHEAIGLRWSDGRVRRVWPFPEDQGGIPINSFPVGIGFHNTDGSNEEAWRA